MGFHLTLSEENERERERVWAMKKESQIALHSYGQPFKEFQQIHTTGTERQHREKKHLQQKQQSLHRIKKMWSKKNGTDECAEQEEMEQMYFST